MNMDIIECTDITKDYINNRVTTKVLKGINFVIKKGDFCLITGRSGSGKSTLLYIMSGLEKPTSGNIRFYKKELSSLNDKDMADIRKSRIGFVFQFYNLLPNLTVYENIKLAKIIAGNQDDDIDDILALVGMQERKHHFPTELSGGEQQRVAIARAIINKPDIIFADEPTGNLDVAAGIAIMDLFKDLNTKYNKTIVLVTHSLDNVKYATRKIELLDGKIISDEQI